MTWHKILNYMTKYQISLHAYKTWWRQAISWVIKTSTRHSGIQQVIHHWDNQSMHVAQVANALTVEVHGFRLFCSSVLVLLHRSKRLHTQVQDKMAMSYHQARDIICHCDVRWPLCNTMQPTTTTCISQWTSSRGKEHMSWNQNSQHSSASHCIHSVQANAFDLGCLANWNCMHGMYMHESVQAFMDFCTTH